MIAWEPLTKLEQIQEVIEKSSSTPVLIFKHSTRCSISKTALERLNRQMPALDKAQLEFQYLDLLHYRDISNQIAETFGVIHESPQILLISNGKCILHQSHLGIQVGDILQNSEIKN